MTDFGVVPEGFRLKVLRDVLDEIEGDQKAEISTTLDVTPESPDGQRNGISARQHASSWEVLASCTTRSTRTRPRTRSS
jgi:hypothetical protein